MSSAESRDLEKEARSLLHLANNLLDRAPQGEDVPDHIVTDLDSARAVVSDLLEPGGTLRRTEVADLRDAIDRFRDAAGLGTVDEIVPSSGGSGRDFSPGAVIDTSPMALRDEDCEGLLLKLGEQATVARIAIHDTVVEEGPWELNDIESFTEAVGNNIERVLDHIAEMNCMPRDDVETATAIWDEFVDAADAEDWSGARHELKRIKNLVSQHVDLERPEQGEHHVQCARTSASLTALEDQLDLMVSAAEARGDEPIGIATQPVNGEQQFCILLKRAAGDR